MINQRLSSKSLKAAVSFILGFYLKGSYNLLFG